MTEVEFSRLLLELTQSAKLLNRESDSINDVISRFEKTLCGVNLGIEVWLTQETLDETRWAGPDGPDGIASEEGTHDVQLGFAKVGGEWHLSLRKATWRNEREDRFTLLGTSMASKLLDASRELRIKALSRFPALARAMKDEAESALKAIADAKKFVS